MCRQITSLRVNEMPAYVERAVWPFVLLRL